MLLRSVSARRVRLLLVESGEGALKVNDAKEIGCRSHAPFDTAIVGHGASVEGGAVVGPLANPDDGPPRMERKYRWAVI
jgi:hypothetical protein